MSSRAPRRCQVPFASAAFSCSCHMKPVICAAAAVGSSISARICSSLFATFAQLLQRDELIALGADPVEELLQRLEGHFGPDDRRVPEERSPCIAHHFV